MTLAKRTKVWPQWATIFHGRSLKRDWNVSNGKPSRKATEELSSQTQQNNLYLCTSPWPPDIEFSSCPPSVGASCQSSYGDHHTLLMSWNFWEVIQLCQLPCSCGFSIWDTKFSYISYIYIVISDHWVLLLCFPITHVSRFIVDFPIQTSIEFRDFPEGIWKKNIKKRWDGQPSALFGPQIFFRFFPRSTRCRASSACRAARCSRAALRAARRALLAARRCFGRRKEASAVEISSSASSWQKLWPRTKNETNMTCHPRSTPMQGITFGYLIPTPVPGCGVRSASVGAARGSSTGATPGAAPATAWGRWRSTASDAAGGAGRPARQWQGTARGLNGWIYDGYIWNYIVNGFEWGWMGVMKQFITGTCMGLASGGLYGSIMFYHQKLQNPKTLNGNNHAERKDVYIYIHI